MLRIFMLLLVIGAVCRAQAAEDTAGSFVPVFVGGEEGYACFRIPAMVTTAKGALRAIQLPASPTTCGHFSGERPGEHVKNIDSWILIDQ